MHLVHFRHNLLYTLQNIPRIPTLQLCHLTFVCLIYPFQLYTYVKAF